eukprot:5441634-Pleurochrysis_carterae.AAC.2
MACCMHDSPFWTKLTLAPACMRQACPGRISAIWFYSNDVFLGDTDVAENAQGAGGRPLAPALFLPTRAGACILHRVSAAVGMDRLAHCCKRD